MKNSSNIYSKHLWKTNNLQFPGKRKVCFSFFLFSTSNYNCNARFLKIWESVLFNCPIENNRYFLIAFKLFLPLSFLNFEVEVLVKSISNNQVLDFNCCLVFFWNFLARKKITLSKARKSFFLMRFISFEVVEKSKSIKEKKMKWLLQIWVTFFFSFWFKQDITFESS